MQDFQTTNSITYYYNVCLGYAIEACKATEAIEWEKGDAGGDTKTPNDIRGAQCHQNFLGTEEHRRNT